MADMFSDLVRCCSTTLILDDVHNVLKSVTQRKLHWSFWTGGQFGIGSAIILSTGPDMIDSSKQNVGQVHAYGNYFNSTLHSAQIRNVWPLLRRKLVCQNHVTVTLFTIND